MKKLFALMMVTGFAVAFVACGGKKAVDTEKMKADSIAKADSTAKVEAEAAAVKMKADFCCKSRLCSKSRFRKKEVISNQRDFPGKALDKLKPFSFSMDSKKIESILVQHVPAEAVNYCTMLWEELPFNFKLRKSRLSKVGDFTCRSGQSPQITINSDLHPFLFLMTYVHEVAHLKVHKALGFKAEAHGDDWKTTFQALMAPLLSTKIFPEPLLTGLRKHMASPKASSFSDSELTHLFRSLNEREKSAVLLSQIPEGSIFHLHGRWFKKGKLRRTRVLCHEVKTRRQYLVPVDVPVTNTQLALL